MTDTTELFVTSDISRDLLQSAALFKHESKVIWEYVVNSLQYSEPGLRPLVDVRIEPKKKRITIRDNGRGMTMEGLRNFFVMHGENQDRRAGRPGRGLFGTGKSAAFAIARSLTVTTVRDRKRSKVRLTRAAVTNARGSTGIPVEVLESEARCKDPNGTLIEIDEVTLERLEPKRVIQFIERQLERLPHEGTVFVNQQECKYEPPTSLRSLTVRPSPQQAAVIGDCALTLKVAAQPLDEDRRGVMVMSNGVLHEVTLAGSENKDMAGYIFGEIDVPALDGDDSDIPPFDMSRSGLRRENRIVQGVIGFIHEHVEKLRRELAAAEKARKQQEEDKRLQAQADEIARIINADFADFRDFLKRRRARAPGATDASQYVLSAQDGADALTSGEEVPAMMAGFDRPPVGDGVRGEGDPRQLSSEVRPGDENAPLAGRRARQHESDAPRFTGGFGIKFRSLGENEDRAAYSKNEREIVINLDHPQLRAARGQGTEQEITFRRLAYEVAFSEYAIALAIERAEEDDLSDLVDAIMDIRKTVNRVARRAAHLYKAPA